VHALDGAAERAVRCDGFLVGGLPADGMIEDVDTRGAGAGGWAVSCLYGDFGCLLSGDTG
jgi:hypothetical protein